MCMSTPGVANPRARPRFSRVQSPQISQLRRHLCTSQSRAHFLPRPWLSCREGSADPSSRPAPAARGQLASQPSGRWIAQLLATRSSTLETLQLYSHVVAKRKCRKSDTKILLLVVESAFTCLDPTKVRDRSNAAQWPKTHGDANPQLRRTKPQAGTLPAENHVGA